MKAFSGFFMWTCFFFSSSFLASDCFLWRRRGQKGEYATEPREARRDWSVALGAVNSRAVERADVAVGGFLLDVGRDDGRVRDARGVQTVVRGHHVWGEPRGQKTV